MTSKYLQSLTPLLGFLRTSPMPPPFLRPSFIDVIIHISRVSQCRSIPVSSSSSSMLCLSLLNFSKQPDWRFALSVSFNPKMDLQNLNTGYICKWKHAGILVKCNNIQQQSKSNILPWIQFQYTSAIFFIWSEIWYWKQKSAKIKTHQRQRWWLEIWGTYLMSDFHNGMILVLSTHTWAILEYQLNVSYLWPSY